MSTLFLIRHGQASYGKDDYDQLSPLGEQQGARLGNYFARRQHSFDSVYVGPRKRHRQTYAAVRRGLQDSNLNLPEATYLPALDEHQCTEVLAHHREHLSATEASQSQASGSEAEALREYLRLFRRGSLMWARGELETPEGLEDWAIFRARITACLEDLRHRETDPGKRISIFTSGGVVAAAIGAVLNLDDEATIELSWGIRNASVSTLHLSSRGYSMTSFNTVPFPEKKLWTYV